MVSFTRSLTPCDISQIEMPGINIVGSGARATGKNAFTAISEDSTGASWNPAGVMTSSDPFEIPISSAYRYNHLHSLSKPYSLSSGLEQNKALHKEMNANGDIQLYAWMPKPLTLRGLYRIKVPVLDFVGSGERATGLSSFIGISENASYNSWNPAVISLLRNIEVSFLGWNATVGKHTPIECISNTELAFGYLLTPNVIAQSYTRTQLFGSLIGTSHLKMPEITDISIKHPLTLGVQPDFKLKHSCLSLTPNDYYDVLMFINDTKQINNKHSKKWRFDYKNSRWVFDSSSETERKIFWIPEK